MDTQVSRTIPPSRPTLTQLAELAIHRRVEDISRLAADCWELSVCLDDQCPNQSLYVTCQCIFDGAHLVELVPLVACLVDGQLGCLDCWAMHRGWSWLQEPADSLAVALLRGLEPQQESLIERKHLEDR